MSQPLPPLPAEPPPPPRASRKRTVITALAGALAGAVIVGAAWLATSTSDSPTGTKAATASNAASKTTPGTFTLLGTFVLTEGAIDDGALGCEGTGGYDDIGLGTSVTVYDAAGTVIAASELVLSDFDSAARSCSFDISVDNVPDGERFYQVEISHRGKVQLSAEEAKSGGFSGSLG